MKQEIHPKNLNTGVFLFGSLFCLALIGIATLVVKPHFWQSGGLVGVPILFLLLIFVVVFTLPFFSRLTWDDDTLTYRGPQMPTETIQIVDIARINVILVVSRAGEIPVLEFVGTTLGSRFHVHTDKRFRVPTMPFDQSDLTSMLQALKTRNPNIIFDERAEYLLEGKPLPTS